MSHKSYCEKSDHILAAYTKRIAENGFDVKASDRCKAALDAAYYMRKAEIKRESTIFAILIAVVVVISIAVFSFWGGAQ